jgi:uncharacterized protein YggE
MQLNTKEVKKALSLMVKGGNNVLPILDNILIQSKDGKVTFTSSNLRQTVRVELDGNSEQFTACIDAALFTATISAIDVESFDFVSDGTTAKINAITAYLTSAGIDKKDIQTSDYSVSPQYDYSQAVCPAASTNGVTIYCPPGKQTLKGYEVRQTTTIKVRDTAKAGDLLAGVGSKGATEVSSLAFTFDNPDTVQDQARNDAIGNAKRIN